MSNYDEMKKGDIIHIGDNMPARIRNIHKTRAIFTGRQGLPPYNGYAKVDEIQGDKVTLLGLYGEPDGRGWYAHPIHYRLDGDELVCLEPTADPTP